MNILITGATGLIGQALVDELIQQGHKIFAVSRNKSKAEKALPRSVQVIECDLVQFVLKAELGSVDAVIHLMGESVASGRWTEKRKKEIYDSRILSAKNLIRSFSTAPKLFITGSAIGIYGDRGEDVLDEGSASGGDFLAQVCKDWEAEALEIKNLPNGDQCRIVQVRTGLVLSSHGGALEKMIPLFRNGLGGPVGKGQHWMSWIHLQDLVRIFSFVIDHPTLSGPINATANDAKRNKDFSKLLAQSFDRGLGPSVPGFALRLIFGEMAQILLASQRVVPQKLLGQNFRFNFPTLAEAFADVRKQL